MQIIVDTNVLVRMGFMLTATLFTELPGGYVVCTLESLIKEFKNKSQLTQKFPEGYAEDYIEELEKVKFVPTEEEEEAIEENIRVWLGYTQDHVEMERKAAGLTLSRLSKPDVDILFTAWTMDFHLATDEDPMTRAFHYLNEEKRIQIFSTLTLMKLLEDIDVVNEDKRKRCIKKIISDSEEFMPKGWKQHYQAIFNTSSIP